MTNPSGEQWRDITGTEEVVQFGDECSYLGENRWFMADKAIGTTVNSWSKNLKFRRPIPSSLEEKKEKTCKHSSFDFNGFCRGCKISIDDALILADKRTSEAEEKLALCQKFRERLRIRYQKKSDELLEAKACLLHSRERLSSAEKERDEARKALGPFADMAQQYDPSESDDAIVNKGSLPITLGLLRAAKSALNEKGEKG